MDQGSGPKANGGKMNASISCQDSSHPEITESQSRVSMALPGGGGWGSLTISISFQKWPHVWATKQRHKGSNHMCSIHLKQVTIFTSFSNGDSFSKQKKRYWVCEGRVYVIKLLNWMSRFFFVCCWFFVLKPNQMQLCRVPQESGTGGGGDTFHQTTSTRHIPHLICVLWKKPVLMLSQTLPSTSDIFHHSDCWVCFKE